MSPRIFISYASHDRPITESLANILDGAGFSVWWDRNLLAGEKFPTVIGRQIDEADAVIVIWTQNSIESDWVYSEAQRAYTGEKLIPIFAGNLDSQSIPMPFSSLHTVTIEDSSEIVSAIRGVVEKRSSLTGKRLDDASGAAYDNILSGCRVNNGVPSETGSSVAQDKRDRGAVSHPAMLSATALAGGGSSGVERDLSDGRVLTILTDVLVDCEQPWASEEVAQQALVRIERLLRDSADEPSEVATAAFARLLDFMAGEQWGPLGERLRKAASRESLGRAAGADLSLIRVLCALMKPTAPDAAGAFRALSLDDWIALTSLPEAPLSEALARHHDASPKRLFDRFDEPARLVLLRGFFRDILFPALVNLHPQSRRIIEVFERHRRDHFLVTSLCATAEDQPEGLLIDEVVKTANAWREKGMEGAPSSAAPGDWLSTMTFFHHDAPSAASLDGPKVQSDKASTLKLQVNDHIETEWVDLVIGSLRGAPAEVARILEGARDEEPSFHATVRKQLASSLFGVTSIDELGEFLNRREKRNSETNLKFRWRSVNQHLNASLGHSLSDDIMFLAPLWSGASKEVRRETRDFLFLSAREAYLDIRDKLKSQRPRKFFDEFDAVSKGFRRLESVEDFRFILYSTEIYSRRVYRDMPAFFTGRHRNDNAIRIFGEIRDLVFENGRALKEPEKVWHSISAFSFLGSIRVILGLENSDMKTPFLQVANYSGRTLRDRDAREEWVIDPKARAVGGDSLDGVMNEIYHLVGPIWQFDWTRPGADPRQYVRELKSKQIDPQLEARLLRKLLSQLHESAKISSSE